MKEAAKYIVHQLQADWRFELSDSRSQKEVSKSHASDPYDDRKYMNCLKGCIDHSSVLFSLCGLRIQALPQAHISYERPVVTSKATPDSKRNFRQSVGGWEMTHLRFGMACGAGHLVSNMQNTHLKSLFHTHYQS